jgi:elongation factor G
MGADFFDCVEQMKSKLQMAPAIVTIPVGQAGEFKGIIDLIRMKFVKKDMSDSTHRKYDLLEIPEEHKEYAAEYRERLIDVVSRVDDEITMLHLEGQEIPTELLLKAVRKGTLESAFNPVHCGTSKMFHGVRELLDMVVDFLPSPIDRPPVEGIVPKSKEKVLRKPEITEPFSGLAFKTVAESTGDLVYVRVYSGEFKQGEVYLNTTSGKTERAARIYRMMGNKREEKEVAGPGEIVAVVGLKNTFTGNTLCDEKSPVALESITFPKPVIAQALIPDKTTDETKLADALARLTRDDPTLKFHTDAETNQLILQGMGELHLEVSIEKLHRFPGVKVSTGRPMVAYRQTFAKPVELQTRYIKQTGGRGKFAVINMKYEPLTADRIEELTAALAEKGEKPDVNNIFFESTIFGGAVPREYIPSVESGYREAAARGYKYPFPFVDLRAELFDGKYHDVDSSQDAFKLAAIENFRDAQQAAGIVLLEPIMNVVVIAPETHQGAIAGDINRRRGLIMEMANEKGRSSIKAQIPLANLFGYTTDLRGATSGTASFSMEFSHYAPVREDLADLPKTDKK